MARAGRARLELSLLTEPGDPRLGAALHVLEPIDLLAAIRDGKTPDGLVSWPRAWRERVGDLGAEADAAIRRADSGGLRWSCPGDPGWPDGLGDLDHVEPINRMCGEPLGLWLRGKGSLGALTGTAVAIVGARDATTYGCEVAADIAADVADAGVTVVSGGAFGIDACAHRGALALRRPTIAVLAGGADVDYPRAHTALLERICSDGLVISEQAPAHTPTKSRFLSRNRLIAALGQGTVVVEAARRSGSLNTLNWADNLGRTTMAVPGPITSQASVGVHQALRDGKAIVVTSGADVLESLGRIGERDATPARAVETAYDRLPAPLQRTLDQVDWTAARTTEMVASGLRTSVGPTFRGLEALEIAGFVTRVPTGWLLVRRADLLPGRDRTTVM